MTKLAKLIFVDTESNKLIEKLIISNLNFVYFKISKIY